MSVCPECNGRKHILVDGKWKKCKCLKDDTIKRVVQSSSIPEPLKGLTSKDFEIVSKEDEKLAAYIKQLIAGETTTLSFIYSLFEEKYRKAVILAKAAFSNIQDLNTLEFFYLEDIVEASFNKKDELNLDYDILLISIGDELSNSAHAAKLLNLLSRRLLEKRITIIISSIPAEDLHSVYKENVANIIRAKAKKFNFMEK